MGDPSLCDRLSACQSLGMSLDECILASTVPSIPYTDEPYLLGGVWMNKKQVWYMAVHLLSEEIRRLDELSTDALLAMLEDSSPYHRFLLAGRLWKLDVVITVAEYAARRWAQEPDWEKDEHGILW